ncbi:Uncharacterized protein FKW44_021963, partial [Caligus rogercresseyi]
VENLEELLKEKDNQVDMARNKLSAIQAQTFTSEGTLTSLEEALSDRDKQINQLRDQRDRAEKDIKEEKELHEREITDFKMKMHSLESEVEKLQVRLEKAYAEKDNWRLSWSTLRVSWASPKAELDKVNGDTSSRYNDYNDWRQKYTKAEIEVDRLRQDNDRLHIEMDRLRETMRDREPYTRASPQPSSYAARSAVEIAELADKLDKSQAELRRVQAELRLNTSDYDRSHVELEQMQEK